MKPYRIITILLMLLPTFTFSNTSQITTNDQQMLSNVFNENNIIGSIRTNANVKQALFLNGNYVGENKGYLAYANLSPEFDYDRFTMALSFYAIDFNSNHNTIIVGGAGYRWLILNVNKDTLQLSLNNHKQIYPLSHLQVKTKQWNHLILSVDVEKKQIQILLNGWSSETVNLDHDFEFQVKQANNNNDKLITFSDFSTTGVFHGFITDVKVFNTAFNSAEMWLLYLADTIIFPPTTACF